MRILTVLAVVLGLLMLGGLVSMSTHGRPVAAATRLKLTPVERTLLKQVNDLRASKGLRKLGIGSNLERAARAHAANMARYSYFAHTFRKDGADVDFFTWIGWYTHDSWVGENIACGYPTVASAMTAWINSPGHYANLIRPQFTLIGVARGTAPVYMGGVPCGPVWVTDFGAP
jgi:uncharacterized protein YkwD